jgi:ribosomal protein RSM22 (predicted rRNA methylase)
VPVWLCGIAENVEAGFNEQQVCWSVIVFMFAYPDEEIRPQIANIRRIQSNDVQIDAFGDLKMVSMRLPPGLPPDLKATLDRLAHGMSRKAIADRAAAQSQNYRAGSGSHLIATADDVLAYAFARLPATYAAAIAVFNAMQDTLPTIRPRSMLDVGAGPGTATFAAVQAFETLADICLIDANGGLRNLALTLMAEADSETLRQVVHAQSYLHGDALTLLAEAQPADLVIASYVTGEIAADELTRFTQLLWKATALALVIVAPGTPEGYKRLMHMRGELIAAGARVAAPCPHDRPCPLRPPDWCHFAQRLPRSREHLRIKGAEVPFEDEKFSYVVLSRGKPQSIDARVLAPPEIAKSAITAKLCTDGGVETDIAVRRNADAYRRRKSWRWGDSVPR